MSIWTESLLVHLEHGGPLPPELQGDPIEYYYAISEGRIPENRSRKSLETITEQNRDTLRRQALSKKCVVENITEKGSEKFTRDRSYSEDSVSKSPDLLSVASSNIEESLSDIDTSVDGVTTILDKLNFQECTSDMEISSTLGDTKFSLPKNISSLSDTSIFGLVTDKAGSSSLVKHFRGVEVTSLFSENIIPLKSNISLSWLVCEIS